MSKKRIGLIICAVVVVVAAIAGVIVYNHLDHQSKYITIDGVEYSRSITELDLSGQTITELEKITELTELEVLNVRDTGITMAQYDELHYELLDCNILWSVPFQGGYVDNDLEALTVDTLSVEDFTALSYLSNLKSVNADGEQNFEAIQQLKKRYPNLEVYYTIEIEGVEYPQDQQTLELTDPDVDALLEKLQYLPQMATVTLDGALPEQEILLQLQQAYPDVVFDFDFQMFGITVNTLDEFVDLSNITIASTDDVKAMMPYFYNLAQVDMVNCGISNEDMDALNRSYEDTKFVWTVQVSGVTLRTDIIYFMPYQYDIKRLGDCYNLKYCTDMVILDVGHYYLGDFSFVEYMPKLEFLGLCQDPIYDVSAIANCTSLRVLEIFLTYVDDMWPLTNLTNLEDLNVSYMPKVYQKWAFNGIGDITPLYQMTWLDRLWMANSQLTAAEQDSLREALPGTTLLFYSDSSTNRGWRQSPNYYEQRDILGMWYMIH